MTNDEGDRWFHIAQDRKREQNKLIRRAIKRERAREYARRSREMTTAPVTMSVTEWVEDEHGNLCRTVRGE